MRPARIFAAPAMCALYVLGLGPAMGGCSLGPGGSSSNSSGNATTDTASGTAPGGTDSQGESTGSGTSGASSGDATSDGSGGSDGTTSATATGGTVKFDLGLAPDIEMPEKEGCKKVDFLFVIDNSASMSQQQIALAASFPGFIAEIESTIASDFHVMAIDTDAVGGKPGFPPCDHVLGAGQVTDQNAGDCGITSGARYMLDSQTDLTGTFECVALQGTFGNNRELPMEAMVQAVTDQNLPGACNEGFVRDDAILVVTVLTDEEDDMKSMGDPMSWRAALVGAKNGNENAVVVLGLLGDSDLPNSPCTSSDGEPAPILRSFTESFFYGSWASICSLDYAPFFAAAVETVRRSCDGFEPPG